MKTFVLLAVLLCAGSASAREKYQCVVTSAVVKNPDSSTLTDATKQDPKLKGAVFFVERPSGKITGSALFDNADNQVDVVRDVNGTVDDFVVASKKDSELRVLRVTNHNGKRTFIFFIEALGLLLSGECEKA